MAMPDEKAVDFMQATVIRVLTDIDALDLVRSDKAKMAECIAQALIRHNIKAVFNASDELLDTLDDEIDEFLDALVKKVRRFTR